MIMATKNTTPVKTDAVKATTVKSEAVADKAPAAPQTTVAKATPAAKKTTTAAKATKTTKSTKTVKKAELKTTLNVQFDGKSYTEEDLVKIAKDVWKFDLKKKASDLTSIDLYIKPEEGRAYYVMNKEFMGSFQV